MTLLFPKWLPGNHADYGRVDKVAGLEITANGQTLAWTRDPLDVYAFKVDVPQGVHAARRRVPVPLADRSRAGPRRHDAEHAQPAMEHGRAVSGRLCRERDHLRAEREAARRLAGRHRAGIAAVAPGDVVTYKPVDFDSARRLADVRRPLLQGHRSHPRRASAGAPERRSPTMRSTWKPSPTTSKRTAASSHQMHKLYGARPLRSLRLPVRAQRPDVGHRPGTPAFQRERRRREVLHRRGIRRPAAATCSRTNTTIRGTASTAVAPTSPRRRFNTPMQGSLLWVYEGQTQYWGNVITARAGLRNFETAKDALALVAATLRRKPRRACRGARCRTPPTTRSSPSARRRPMAAGS